MRLLPALLLATAAGAQEAPIAEGERLLAERDFEKAAAAFAKAIEGAPGDARGWTGRGKALQRLGRDREAIDDFSRAIASPAGPDPLVLVLRAHSRRVLGDHEGAISDCGKAIVLAPDLAAAYRVRGDALRAMREDAAALREYDRALDLAPRDLEALRSRGGTSEKLRMFAAARRDYTRLTELDIGSPTAYALRGHLRLRMGDARGALEDFELAIGFARDRSDPPDRGLHVASARALLALGQKDRAEAELKKAVEPPADADAFAERGRLNFDIGRTKEAAADLAKAVEMDPEGQDRVRLYLFLARARLGERAAAAGELETYVTRRGKKDWFETLATFLRGAIEEPDLLAAAGSANPQVAIERECEACWYAGALRLLEGDANAARGLLKRCVATDVRTFIEYESARMAFAAMK